MWSQDCGKYRISHNMFGRNNMNVAQSIYTRYYYEKHQLVFLSFFSSHINHSCRGIKNTKNTNNKIMNFIWFNVLFLHVWLHIQTPIILLLEYHHSFGPSLLLLLFVFASLHRLFILILPNWKKVGREFGLVTLLWLLANNNQYSDRSWWTDVGAIRY